MERPIPLQTLFYPKKKKKKRKKKAVEQDVGKVALERVSKRIRDEGCPLIYEVCYIMIVML